jgi:hypothetical protein
MATTIYATASLCFGGFSSGSGSFAVNAPVGQVETQRPQELQAVSDRGMPRVGSTMVSKPRFTKPKTLSPSISSQIRIQRPHRIHLFWSLRIRGCSSLLTDK